jgi:hypothetical protein
MSLVVSVEQITNIQRKNTESCILKMLIKFLEISKNKQAKEQEVDILPISKKQQGSRL